MGQPVTLLAAQVAGVLGMIFLATVVLEQLMEHEARRRERRDEEDERRARIRRRERGL